MATDLALSLVPMRSQHVAQVADIERQASFMPWPQSLIEQCLRDGYINHLLFDADDAIGFSVCSTGADEAHLQNIVVVPAQQGRGAGYWLLEQTVRKLKERALQRLFLEVRASNHPAIHLYQQYGFENIGLRKDYYEAPVGREDAYVYMLEL